jgi:hypothetical protein
VARVPAQGRAGRGRRLVPERGAVHCHHLRHAPPTGQSVSHVGTAARPLSLAG